MEFSVDKLLAHVRVLSESFPQRHAGEEDQRGAARYIADQFRQGSLSVEEIETPILGWQVDGSPTLEITAPEHRDMEFAPYVYSAPTPDGGLEGRLVRVGSTLGSGAEPWRKYAIVDDDGQWRALVIGRPDGPAMSRRGTPGGSVTVTDGGSWARPACVIGQEDSDQIEEWLEQGVPVRAKYSLQCTHKVGCISVNVCATVTGTDYPDEVVIVGVHHDAAGAIGFPESVACVGANDNASGVAILLEMASWYQAHGSSRTLWFCSFDAEERGLMGSSEFLRRISESGELDRVIAYVGIDQAAHGDAFWMLASSDEPHLAPSVDMTAITQGVIDQLGLADQSDLRGPLPLHSASDHWPFFYAGVPAVLIGWHPFQGYHRGEDTIDQCVHDDQFLQCARTADALVRSVLAQPSQGRTDRPLSAGLVIHPPNMSSDGKSAWPKV